MTCWRKMTPFGGLIMSLILCRTLEVFLNQTLPRLCLTSGRRVCEADLCDEGLEQVEGCLPGGGGGKGEEVVQEDDRD